VLARLGDECLDVGVQPFERVGDLGHGPLVEAVAHQGLEELVAHGDYRCGWYRFPPRRSEVLHKREKPTSKEVQEIAWLAQQRLYRKYTKLLGRGKNIQRTMTAVPRELVGFIWAIDRESKLLAEAS
jgi:hypothetical protein